MKVYDDLSEQVKRYLVLRRVNDGSPLAEFREEVVAEMLAEAGAEELSPDRRVEDRFTADLTEWLTEARAAREAGHEIGLCDDPVRRAIGFVADGVCYNLGLSKLKASGPVPEELAAFFGMDSDALRKAVLTPEDRRRLLGIGTEDFFAYSSRVEAEAEAEDLTSLWETQEAFVEEGDLPLDRPEPKEYGPEIRELVVKVQR